MVGVVLTPAQSDWTGRCWRFEVWGFSIFIFRPSIWENGKSENEHEWDRIHQGVADVSRAVMSLMVVIADIRNGTEPLNEEPLSKVSSRMLSDPYVPGGLALGCHFRFCIP